MDCPTSAWAPEHHTPLVLSPLQLHCWAEGPNPNFNVCLGFLKIPEQKKLQIDLLASENVKLKGRDSFQMTFAADNIFGG